jgi:hypothetical protein
MISCVPLLCIQNWAVHAEFEQWVPVMASVGKSVNMTRGHWRLEERYKVRHREKLGLGGSDAPNERHWRPLLYPSTFIYTVHMRSQFRFKWAKSRSQQNKDTMVSFFSILTILYPSVKVNMSCFP